MGSPEDEEGRLDTESPVHNVKIQKPFYLGIYPVTQEQWKKLMGENPSFFKDDDLPVEQVSWEDVQKFVKKLNKKEDSDKYRLPSEAEWEYATHAGTTTRYYFGNDDSELMDYAWYRGNSERKTRPVGHKKPNQWGLYDMYGNVWEWVQDKWHSNYDGAPADGTSWEKRDNSYRVIRGGAWSGNAKNDRSAYRSSSVAGYLHDDIGFRLLRIL